MDSTFRVVDQCRLRITAVAVAALLSSAALAHHPGSHASRQPDGRVRVDIVATASDSCTSIASVAPGAPAGIRPPQGSEPVTVRLVRPAGAACATMVTAARADATISVPPRASHLHVYILGPDGQVQGTERVPVR